MNGDRVVGTSIGKAEIKFRTRGNHANSANIYVNVVDPTTSIEASVSLSEYVEVEKGTTRSVWIYPKPETTVGRFNIRTSGPVTAKISSRIFAPVPFTPFPKNYRTLEITASNNTGTGIVTLTLYVRVR